MKVSARGDGCWGGRVYGFGCGDSRFDLNWK